MSCLLDMETPSSSGPFSPSRSLLSSEGERVAVRFPTPYQQYPDIGDGS